MLSAATLNMVMFFMYHFVEVKRWQDFRKPKSQAEKGTFFGLEAAFEGKENGKQAKDTNNPIAVCLMVVVHQMVVCELQSFADNQLILVGCKEWFKRCSGHTPPKHMA